MRQADPLATPERNQRALVMSASTTSSIFSLSNSAHVLCDALTSPVPYAATYNIIPRTYMSAVADR